MKQFNNGYKYYVERCKAFGIQPILFPYYVQQLSNTQLLAYNERALQQAVQKR